MILLQETEEDDGGEENQTKKNEVSLCGSYAWLLIMEYIKIERKAKGKMMMRMIVIMISK